MTCDNKPLHINIVPTVHTTIGTNFIKPIFSCRTHTVNIGPRNINTALFNPAAVQIGRYSTEVYIAKGAIFPSITRIVNGFFGASPTEGNSSL